MGHLGFEPRTNRLKAEYSSAELMSHKRFKFSSFFEDCFPHHSLRIPPNPVWVKWVVPVFQVAHRRFEDCFPHHPINIPGFGPQRKIIRPVPQLSQDHKKRGETFWILPLNCFLWLVLLTLTYHIRNQEGLSNKPAVHRIITLRL